MKFFVVVVVLFVVFVAARRIELNQEVRQACQCIRKAPSGHAMASKSPLRTASNGDTKPLGTISISEMKKQDRAMAIAVQGDGAHVEDYMTTRKISIQKERTKMHKMACSLGQDTCL